MAKRMLQIILVVIGLIATVTGLWGMSKGNPSLAFIGFTLLELLFPLLIWWQNKLSPHNPAANFNDLAG